MCWIIWFDIFLIYKEKVLIFFGQKDTKLATVTLGPENEWGGCSGKLRRIWYVPWNDRRKQGEKIWMYIFFSHVKPWRIAYYIAPYFTLSPLQGWEKIGKCKVEMLLLSNELSEKKGTMQYADIFWNPIIFRKIANSFKVEKFVTFQKSLFCKIMALFCRHPLFL